MHGNKKEQDYILDKDIAIANEPVIKAEQKVYTWSQLLNFKATWSIISSRFFIDPV